MIAIDTNVLLRYLIQPIDKNNPKWQVDVATKLIDSSRVRLSFPMWLLLRSNGFLESVFQLLP